jgi:hypothetical protein
VRSPLLAVRVNPFPSCWRGGNDGKGGLRCSPELSNNVQRDQMAGATPIQLIRLTLLDGDPEGLRSAGVAGRTTILMGCPWSRLQTLLARREAKRTAVYFMVGTPLEGDSLFDEVVYIGECDSLASRFEQHHKQDAADWGQIFLATTTESTFNKAHARFAEHLLVERAKGAGRMRVLTKATSRGSIDDEGDVAFAQEFVENVVTLTQTLGVILFRPSLQIRSSKGEANTVADATVLTNGTEALPRFRFQYTSENIPAEMITDGKDFVVLKGSRARPDSAGIPPGIKEMREAARAAGILTKEPGSALEVFQADYPTTSVSAAGALVYGSACQGPKAWHHVETDQTYSEWVKGRAEASDPPSGD